MQIEALKMDHYEAIEAFNRNDHDNEGAAVTWYDCYLEAQQRCKLAEVELAQARQQIPALPRLELGAALSFLERLQTQHLYLHDGHGSSLSREDFIRAVTVALPISSDTPAERAS